MHTEQRQQTHALLRSRGLSRALFADPHSITWLTGFAPPVQTGPNLFAGGPPLLWYEDGHFTLLVLDAHAGLAAPFAQESDGEVVTYPGYTIEAPVAGPTNLANALRQCVAGARGRVGIEEVHLTALLLSVFPPQVELDEIDGWLAPLRMVKTAEELAKLRRNFALTDIGQAAARGAVAVGQREIDVWMAAHSAINREAGRRVPLGNDCVVGYRENNIGGWPLDHPLRPGDSLIVDLSTILYGYWSDSCATYFATEPDDRQRAMHRAAGEALELAITLIRPGVAANEIDRRVRAAIAGAGFPVYPHHTGHGVGVSGHEAPRIVPYDDTPLQAGMVLLIEPGIYFPGETGVRLEDAVLVTADGAEVLTHHDKSLP